jgi:hypothetical protein
MSTQRYKVWTGELIEIDEDEECDTEGGQWSVVVLAEDYDMEVNDDRGVL